MEDDEDYTIEVNLSASEWVNIWALFGTVVVFNAICVVLYVRSRKNVPSIHDV